MAGRADIQAGSAFVRLFLKDDLTKALKGTISGIASTVKQATMAFGALSAPIAGAIAQFVSFGSEINDMAGRTGTSAKSLQEWIFAAKQSGASAEDVERALKSMAKNGLSVSDFERVGASIASIQDPSERAAKAIETFGKTGTRLLPMFAELNSLKQQSKALGELLSEDEVRMADRLGDAFTALLESIKRFGMQIAATFGPQLIGALQTAIGVVTALSEAISGKGTTFSGDLLDRLTQFLNMPFDEFRARGKGATDSFSRLMTGAGVDAEDSRTNKLAKQADMIKDIENAERRRFALINEFATPLERFLQKERQIIEAIKEANRNRVLGFISPEQAAAERKGLETALFRARAAEMERRAKLEGKPMAIAEAKTGEPPRIQLEATSAASAFGALALGFGGGGSPQNRVAVALEKNGKREERMIQLLTLIERSNRITAVFGR